MLRISALNDSSCSEDDSQKVQLTKTKEAKEAEAFAAYNKALSHQQKGNTLHAEKLLRNLFDHPLLKEASSLIVDETQTQSLNHPGLQLLYSIQKNLASILLQRGQLHEAMAAYIEAVKIDSSEVTVWFKMGQVAKDLHNYPLAKICFQQALQCNPNHWPSLDNAITVTYALGNYLMCLENISTALEKDYRYPKGLALRKQILSEQPSLESVTAELFLYCDPRMHSTSVDPDEAKQFINEALKVRAKRRQLILEHQEKELQPLTFLKPLTPFTWKNVGEQLIDLYDYAVGSDPPKSLALEVDLRDYFFLDHLAFLGESVTQGKQPAPMYAKKDESMRRSLPLLRKVTIDLAGDDGNAAFQRAKEKAGDVPSVPQFLNIKDNARESALIRRIQGDIARADLPSSEYPDLMSKINIETHSEHPDHVSESVQDEELDAMDMSDVQLLPEEDMNLAVLSLKDIRKTDFRPELLLKANVEDLSGLPDARSLENVLSSVIDMEMQGMYAKSFAVDLEVQSNTGMPASSSSLPDTVVLQMSEAMESDKLSTHTHDKLVCTVISNPKEKFANHIREINQLFPISDATSTSALDIRSRQVDPKTLLSLAADHPLGVPPSNLWTTHTLQLITTCSSVVSASQALYSQSNPQPNPTVLHTSPYSPGHASLPPSLNPLHPQTSRATTSPPPAHSTPTRNPLQPYPFSRTNISPLPAHSTQIQNQLHKNASPTVNITLPLAHSSSPVSQAATPQTQNILPQTIQQSLRTSLTSPVQLSQPTVVSHISPSAASYAHSSLASPAFLQALSSLTPASLQAYSSLTPASLQAHSSLAPASLQALSSLTPASLQALSSLTPVPHQAHSSPASLQAHNSSSHQAHSSPASHQAHSSPASLQAHSSSAPHQAHSSPASLQAHSSSAPHKAHSSPSSLQAHSSPVSHQAHSSPSLHQAHSSPASHQAHSSPASHQAHSSPASHQAHSSPASHQSHSSPSPHQAHSSPASHQAHSSPASHQMHSSPASHQAHSSPSPHQTHSSPASNQAHNSPSPHQVHSSPSPHQVHSSPSPHQVHSSPSPHQVHSSPSPHQVHSSPSPHQAHSSPTSVPPQTNSTTARSSSKTSQPSTVPTTQNLPDQHHLQYASRLTVLPTEYIHSPITTSLLSPNSVGSCSKSVSAYYSVLSSLERSSPDSGSDLVSAQSGRKSESSLLVPSKSPQKADELSSLKGGNVILINQSSSDLIDRLTSGDQIGSIRDKTPHGESSTERSSHLLKTYQKSQMLPRHPSPQSTPGSGQCSTNRLPTYHQELVTSMGKLPLIHHTPSSNISSLSQTDTPSYLYHRYPESYNESLTSRPVNSQLETETFLTERTEKLTDQKQTNLKRSKPPPLSRSSSLPGYYTATPDQALLSYLSPPPHPTSLASLFRPSGQQSPHVTSQQSLSLPHMTNLFPSPVYPPSSLPISRSDIASHRCQSPLYSSILSGLASSPQLFSSLTTLPPYLTPLKSPNYADLYHHRETIKPPLQHTSYPISDEKTLREHKILKPQSAGAGQHPYHHSNPTSCSSSQHGWPQQKQPTPRQSQATTQLQNLARIAQQLPPYDNIYSGDHSYHQAQGPVFQAVVESMLLAVGKATRQPSSQAPVTSPKGSQAELANTFSEASKKRAQGGNRTQGVGAKRGPKRKSDEPGCDEWFNANKRRSTRSRNTRNRKEDKSIDYQNLMKKFFPQSFLNLAPDSDAEKNSEIDMEIDTNVNKDDGAEMKNGVDFSSLQNLVATEDEDIKAYIKKCLKGHGILDLVYKYLLKLARKGDLVWYEGMTDIYMNLYARLRKHLTIPTLFCGDDDTFTPEGLGEYAVILLTWAELSLSRAAADRGDRSYLMPSKPEHPDDTASICLGKHHNEDLMFLLSLTGRDDALGSFRGSFCVRLYWLKARQHQLLNETADAVECFEIVSELLEDVASERGLTKNNVRILVPNVSQDRVISLSEACRQLECLQRCKSLEDTKKLYDQARYDQVVDNLISTFNNKNLNSKVMTQRERPSQLLLLVNSLYNIKRYSECMQWAEASLHEAVLYYKRVSTLQLRQDWAATLVSLFECIDRIMVEDENILPSLTHGHLVRLAHSLVTVIEISLDVAESVTEMPIGSLLPWKLLYRVLRFEEISCDLNKQKDLNQESLQRDAEQHNQEEKELRNSLLMLKQAHEYLGRHSWCTNSDGALLLFIMMVVEKEMEGRSDDDLEELTSIFEQCVYCLYGHPNKRGRAKHLNDHNCSQVTLTWERSGTVFHHFATQSVPEFDSYKTSTVTADVENLLRRIFALVPEKINPNQGLAAITDYIEGSANSVSTIPAMTIDKNLDPYNISGLLYYLLGDFYFKSKEQTKAVKLYQLDLVLNVNRLDSWAGLSLAKMSQIEQKLNSTELKIEKPIHKNSEGALRCFRRAVELEAGSCKLWLEYGSLAYQLHSHASRQMKYKDMFSLTEEVLQIAMSRRLDLLLVAKNSYLQASRCEGEDTEEGWLTFYMMGKVAEKQLEHPSVYLEYYKQAAACLHEEKAVYPKKIQFVIPPPHLALEALEVFYRIHVCSLKLILSGCGDDYLMVLDSYVTYALQGHFATGEEKQQKIVEEDKPVVREEEFVTPKSTTTSNSLKPQQIYHKNPVHHEYSRHKSTSDSQSEGEEPKCNNPSKASTGGHTSDLGQEEDKSTNHLISNSAVVHDNAGLDTVSISDNVGLDTVSSADNIGLDTVSKSVSYVGPVNINTDIQPSRLYVMDSSNIPERTVADADNSCEGSLKQGFVSSVISVSDVQIQQDIDMVDEMETGEVETMSELVVEVANKASLVRNFSERILGQDVGHGQQDENSFGSMTDIGQCEVSTGVVSCQVMKSGDEGMIGNSQSNSKDNSQDNLPENDYQMSSQDCSQDSVRIEETSEEDTAAMSCGNEADVDTDAMDVDEDVMSATSQDSAETSFEISSHVSNLEHSSDNLKMKVGEIVVEVHAGDDVHEISTGISLIPPGLYHHVTQGFIPHSENLEILPEKTLDIDSFEDDQKHNEKCRDTSLADNRTNVAACIINQAEIAGEIPLDGNGKNMQDPTGKVCSQHVDDMSDLLGETEAVIEKDEIISMNRVSQDQQSEKSSKEISRNKPEGISNNCQIIEALKNGMDAGGDLKDTGKMETQRFDTEDNNEDEKWEKESQEKHSDQILEPSAQSMIVSDISETENVTSAELAVPVLEASANKSPRPTSINNSSTLGDTGLNKLTSEEPNDSKTLSKDSELLKDVLISKCRSGLEMCASRFSSHYKSLYRLAHLYYSTKELDKARDILLGRPDWQDQPHMPTAGLFSERKQNNFFQGLWKLPVEDIDRSGCFASHVHRSVKLLLEVLCDVGDLEMLKNLHNQLRKTPESGKKYLRDAERLVLAEEAFLKCVNVVQHEMDMSDHWSEEQREENLFRIYHVWVSGKGCKHADRVTDALHRAFKIMMKGRTDVNRLTAAQAISFCQQNLTKSLTPSTPTPSSAQNKPGSQSGAERAKDGSVPSTERVKDGPILSRESAKDGSVVPPEGAKDELVVSTESAKDGSVVPTEGAKDGSLVPPEGAIDGSVVPTEGAKDGLAVAAESVNESAVATEGAKDGSIVSIESANGSAVSTEGAKDGSVVSIESANGSAVSTEGAKDGSVVSIESANGSAIPTDGGVDGTVVSLKKEEADKQSEPMEVCVKQEDVMKTSQEVQQSVDVNNSRSSSSSTPAITEQTITESKKAHDDDDDDVIILSD